ncbi:MAG: transaldolase [Anaerolineae bacterium]|nr:transaldolase [Anaerolineae bacterium]
MNTVQALYSMGQSVWYDNIQRGLLRNGEMAGMIERGEVRGVTSNPTIFMTAITRSQDYDDGLEPLIQAGWNAEQIFWQLAVDDIQAAADLFRPLYEQSGGGDGYVSLEVNPYLAQDAERTLVEVKQLWQRVDRPNLMVKIPATQAGLPAITDAIAAGINVNVTLIFSRKRYVGVMDAYLRGLEQRVAQGLSLDSIASVASFFVSRVDTKVDARLQDLGDQAGRATELLGKTAIANTRLAYADFKEMFAADRFQTLGAKGARVQRPLWASTSTKNPAYRDVLYVEELIGPSTVSTIPPQTLKAFLEHGQVRPSLEEDLAGARRILDDLEALGISMDLVTDELEHEGVKAFADAFTELLGAVDARRQATRTVNSKP